MFERKVISTDRHTGYTAVTASPYSEGANTDMISGASAGIRSDSTASIEKRLVTVELILFSYPCDIFRIIHGDNAEYIPPVSIDKRNPTEKATEYFATSDSP